jgi:hypothetical protein
MRREEFPSLAAVAPDRDARDDADDEDVGGERLDLEELCARWSSWCRTRRLYVKPSLPPSLLGRLRSPGPGRGRPGGGPDAVCSAQLMAFHIAFLAQPEDALDRRVFALHYYVQVRNIKAAADAVGVSRQHWYRLAKSCRDRIYQASLQILEQNMAAAQRLPSVRQAGVEQMADQD